MTPQAMQSGGYGYGAGNYMGATPDYANAKAQSFAHNQLTEAKSQGLFGKGFQVGSGAHGVDQFHQYSSMLAAARSKHGPEEAARKAALQKRLGEIRQARENPQTGSMVDPLGFLGQLPEPGNQFALQAQGLSPDFLTFISSMLSSGSPQAAPQMDWMGMLGGYGS
jgi:hypothetical protein